MADPVPEPWWSRLLPDVRGWATFGIFILVAYVFSLIARNPGLANNELFKTATILLLGTGGFGLVCAFLWGGSKASNAAADTVNAIASTGAGPAPNTTTTVTSKTEATDKAPVAVEIKQPEGAPVPVKETPAAPINPRPVL